MDDSDVFLFFSQVMRCTVLLSMPSEYIYRQRLHFRKWSTGTCIPVTGTKQLETVFGQTSMDQNYEE